MYRMHRMHDNFAEISDEINQCLVKLNLQQKNPDFLLLLFSWIRRVLQSRINFKINVMCKIHYYKCTVTHLLATKC